MRALVVTPNRNQKKKDFTGAFRPEADGFSARHGVPDARRLLIDIDASPSARQDALVDAIAAGPKLDALALFTHGLPLRLPQFGWTRTNLGPLAAALGANATKNLRVILYACSTAEGGPAGDGGFADALRDALCAEGLIDCQVDAHEGAGHTTKNPRLRRFEGRGSASGGSGGFWLVTPGSAKWAAWKQKLKTPFRFDFPFLSPADVMAAL